MKPCFAGLVAIVIVAMGDPYASLGAESVVKELVLYPAEVVLRGEGARQALIVTARIDDRMIDVTDQVSFRSLSPEIAVVDAEGVCRSVGDGHANIVAAFQGHEVQASLEVRQAKTFMPLTFERDIQPILARAGCNSGACHGKASGQNGFKLSLLGFDSDFDYDSLTKEARGRRVFPAVPESSLILSKPTGMVPHGGGKRLDQASLHYQILYRWVAQGAPRQQTGDALLERITVEPSDRVMGNEAFQKLLVTAHYSDKKKFDVTHLSTYQSNETGIAGVDENGLITTGNIPGEAAVMVRYMGRIATSYVSVPLVGHVTMTDQDYEKLPQYNFIDEHVWNKLERLGMYPSQPSDDATFIRRAFLDVIGRLPSAEDVDSFLKNADAKKREVLIDELLARPEYGDYWANKWADLLRPNPYRVGIKAVLNLDIWLRKVFRKNMPYDQFVTEIITAQGSTFRDGPTVILRDRRTPDELTTMMSQLFLGIRLECAKCHQHPFEVWGQNDFYGFAAYFAQIGRKGSGLSPPISGSEEFFFNRSDGEVSHPLTGQTMIPRPLFGQAASQGDRRETLAKWMTDGSNQYFSQVMANRVWADLMGRGLVEPVDDLRATNPPTNGPLLKALSEEFRAKNFDIKELLRTIMSSYAYGLSAQPIERNVVDTRNYSRHYRQRLRAEVIHDAICDITGMPSQFAALPEGSRSMEIWTHRTPSFFLDSFGRPDPNQDPPSERTDETTVVQALHLMNAENIHKKVIDNSGMAAKLASSDCSPSEIVDRLYLSVYSRFPTQEERYVALSIFEKEPGARREITEDLMWAMINTPEFVFKN